MKEQPLKCYVIMIAKHFPSTHPRKGEPTLFLSKIINGQESENKNDRPICKLHTIRQNYSLWEKRIKEVQDGKAYLSLREWEGRPYWSDQIEILQLTAADGVGIQKILLFDDYSFSIPDTHNLQYRLSKDLVLVAHNDGLSVDDFKNWFKWKSFNEVLGIIHFTNFRYE